MPVGLLQITERWNDRIDSFFRAWENIILIECKYWSKKVGASEVEWFMVHP